MRCGMIRVILILLVVVVFLLVSALPLLIGEKYVWKNNENRQKEYALKVVKQIFHMIFRLTGSTLTVKGFENIPDKPVLYVGNHRSYFDIVSGYIVVPGQTGFVAKKEMEKIPLLRDWMRNVNCLFLDRKDIKAGLKTILEGIEKELEPDREEGEQEGQIQGDTAADNLADGDSVGNLLVQKAIRYVEVHYGGRITLKDMSEELHLSPNYLCELFKRHTGKNLMEYVTEYRMIKARTYLNHVEYKVSDVAEMVGYKEAKYFSSAFKKTYGITPLEYRNKK